MQRLPMRKIKEALRLKAAGLTQREIAASLGVGRTTVGEYLDRAARAGLIWPLPDEMDDSALERRLFASAGGDQGQARPQPDWQHIHGELRRKSVTLRLLWEEYRAVHPDGYGYSQFCERYRQWKGRLSPTMRQTHAPGERLFVDYAGQTIEFVDGLTGEVVACQLFVAVLGASSYTYAEATRTQSLTDWCSSHEHAFTFFGGVPAQIVSDNLKAGITKACFYEPAVNRTYADLAAHYDTAVVPARPYKPRDKAKVEVGVQLAERWIIAKLRNRTFFSLGELNAAIRACVDHLNARVSRHLGASRRDLFERLIARPSRPCRRAVPVCRMGRAPRRPRLSCRGREALLLGAAQAAAREGLDASDGANGRGLLQGPPRRRPRPFLIQSAPHDGPRAHAVVRIAVMPTGRRSGSDGRPARWDPPHPHSSTSFCANAAIPSRAFAPASASSGSPRLTVATGWRRLAREPSRSERAPTARSTRS